MRILSSIRTKNIWFVSVAKTTKKRYRAKADIYMKVFTDPSPLLFHEKISDIFVQILYLLYKMVLISCVYRDIIS